MIALVIARNTFRETTRDRALVGLVGAGVVLLLGTQLLSPLALGEGRRLTVDLALSAISVLGLLTVMTVGSNLVAKEIERRTIFNLLSRPIARPTYLVGKWIGFTGALWLVATLLGLALWVLLIVRGDPHGVAIVQAVYLAGLELSVIAALAVMFSALSTPLLSALYTMGCFCVGQWSYDLREFATQFPAGLAGPVQIVSNIVPNLPLFNMRSLAAAGLPTTPHHLTIATVYALTYIGCILALAAVAFRSRDFK